MYNDLYCIAIIVAGGDGKRMGSNINKQFLSVENKPILAYTIEKFENISEIDYIIVVTKKDFIEYCKTDIINKYNFRKVKKVVSGGSERQYSVFNGINEIEHKNSIILIHDGVRPLVDRLSILKSIKSAYKFGTGIVGVKSKDTIKISNSDNIVEYTPQRDFVWSIQTPQTFRYDIIYKSYKIALENNFIGTDDSMIVEQNNVSVKIVEGSYDNIKITTPEDIDIFKSILKSERNIKKNIEFDCKKPVDIYTDGACSNNPGNGGYGIVILYNGIRKELSEGFYETTNNRMEMLAVIKALETLKQPCNVNLYSDSRYVVDAIKKGWAKKWKENNWKRNKNNMASNIDMWERLLKLIDIHNVNFIWVKGHADNIENERCDYLAKTAIECGNLQCDEGYKK